VSETVLITGAGIGIGRATAKAFARSGCKVIVTDVLEKEGRSAVAEIADAGGTAEFQRLDVRSTADADALVAAVEQKYGGIDVIVANAGIAHKTPLAALTDDKWDHTLDIDLKGIFRVVRPALAGMRRRRKGAIVCLSSIMGVAYGWDEHVHYSSAKAGVVGLVRGMAVELARDGARQWRCARIHPHGATVVRGAFAGACRRREGRRVHSDGPDRRTGRDRRRHCVSCIQCCPIHDRAGGGGGRRIVGGTVLKRMHLSGEHVTQ
jgi:NAD(P)-dependent dehydrogenase (short-subunit alcohol dehydrogenase family)